MINVIYMICLIPYILYLYFTSKKLMEKKLTLKQKLLIIIYLLLFSWVTIWYFWRLLSEKVQNIDPDNLQPRIKPDTWNNNTTTWVVIDILTWWTDTGSIEIPNWAREYLDYILQYWVAGEDYIAVEPPRPPVIRSDDKQVNNDIMFSYLNKNRITFTIPTTDKKGYVMFVTYKEVPISRDMFLSINWWSKWAIRKNKSLPVAEVNEYLYRMNDVTIAWTDWWWVNLYDYVVDNKLQLNAFVWEQWNYIKKIIIFFK